MDCYTRGGARTKAGRQSGKRDLEHWWGVSGAEGAIRGPEGGEGDQRITQAVGFGGRLRHYDGRPRAGLAGYKGGGIHDNQAGAELRV